MIARYISRVAKKKPDIRYSQGTVDKNQQIPKDFFTFLELRHFGRIFRHCVIHLVWLYWVGGIFFSFSR